MTSFNPLSFWDDELETLSNAVIATFGEQAVSDAVRRATHHCRRTIDPAMPLPAIELSRRLAVAIKTELRRVLMPH
jgi:hypothetical protein